MPADLALVGGVVFTVSEPRFASAVTVTGERISYVGDDRGARDEVGSDTEVIDLAGRLVTPGFQDAHVHPGTSGRDASRVPLGGCSSAEEALVAVAAYAQDHPEEPWILGSGWSQDWFPGACPAKELLDSIVPDRPVYLVNRDGHGGWANSFALKSAGIDANTPDPHDGRIERNPDGAPQGTLHEGARYLVMAVLPPETVDEYVTGISTAQAYLFSKGITAWQDAHVDELNHRAYRRLADSGALKGRVTGALWWDRHLGLQQIEDFEHMRSEPSGRYRPLTVKLMLDGVIENFTASMLKPYLDRSGAATDGTGIDFIDPMHLKEIVTVLDARGFSCHFHAIGDAAVRSGLDAIEAARRSNGVSKNRHHIAHIQVVHPDDHHRFAQLDVTANCQALWANNSSYQYDLTQPFLGIDRSSWQYPFGRLLGAGARLAMGSDWDVSTPDVFEQADVAVNRTDHDEPDLPPLGPGDAITLDQALLGFTEGSSWVNFLDSETGSIEVGKMADIAVADRNPFHEPRPAGTLIDMTLVGGEIVYRR